MALPERLSEFPTSLWENSAFLETVMSQSDTEMKLIYLSKIHPLHVAMMSPVQIADITRAWTIERDYMNVKPLPGWKWLHLDYVAPPVDFATGTLREFIYMDEYMEENNIIELTALLYRRRSRDAADAIRRDDLRTKLVSRMQITQEAATLQRYVHRRGVQRMICGAWMYSIATKQLIHHLYGSRLFSGESNTTHQLGWLSVAMQVAEHHVFGEYESVLDTTLHEVLSYMIIKQAEQDALTQATPDSNT